MKKSLVLAIAMSLGITASAYAANPFLDVPEGHWAYDSLNKLVAAGVIEGYPGGTYGGDKFITRYEMAMMIARAMAKGFGGPELDKLAAEFADELDGLGVRVAKLEKGADNVKITGEIRWRYVDQNADANQSHKSVATEGGDGLNGFVHDLRTRIWLRGAINEDWTYTGMIENVQDFDDDDGEEDTAFQRAYVEGKLGGTKVLGGRYNAFFADGNIYDTRVDGLEITYGDKVKAKGFVGKGTDWDYGSYGDYTGIEVTADMNKLNLMGGFVSFKDMYYQGAAGADGADNDIWYIGANYAIDKNVSVNAMYLKADPNSKYEDNFGQLREDLDKGYVIGINYKGAKADDVGSWGAWAKYYDQGGATYVAHTTDANTFGSFGFKGYGIAANYTPAKNIIATIAYYDTEVKEVHKGASESFGEGEDQRLWADVTFYF